MSTFVRIIASLMMVALSAGPAALANAQQTTPIVDDGVYREPDGRFTVPLPTNWTVEESEGYATLLDPDREFAVDVFVLTAPAVEEALAPAIALVDAPIEPDAEPFSVQAVPSPAGVDESVVITYLTEGDTSIVQMVGLRTGSTVYCLIFRGTIEAAMRRDSQIQIIASGFTITDVDEVDLSGQSPAELTPELLAEFELYAQDLLERLEVPGASIAVVVNGEVAYTGGFGVKELGGADQVTASTMMMIGSTTKSMTTMMMASQVDDGVMTWDQPVIEILPEFEVADPELTETITVRDLVCACTGVPRRDLEFMFNASELTAEDIIASLSEFEFFTGLGEAFQYSNQMVAAGGYAAAAAGGGEYGALYDAYVAEMQTRVFDPIELPNTTLSFDTVVQIGDYAMPHGAVLEGEYVPLPLDIEETLGPVAPAGAVWSTANDMARYLITAMRGGVTPEGDRVVSTENLQETWVPQVAVDADVSYGLGWFIDDYFGLQVIQHGGNTFGFTSDLAFMPERGIGIVVLANGQAANAYTEGLRYRLFELLFEQPADFEKLIDYLIEQAEAEYEALMAQVTDVPADIAGAVAGSYESEVLGRIRLFVEGDELMIDSGEFAMRLMLATGSNAPERHTFITADPPIPGTPFEFRVGGDGVREVVLQFGAETYVFVEHAAAATPVAA